MKFKAVYLGHSRFVVNKSEKFYKIALKAPYSSKTDILFSKKRFNKLIYDINTIIKYGTWQPVKFQFNSLSFLKWNDFLLYLN